MKLIRRQFFIMGLSFFINYPLVVSAGDKFTKIHVVKDPKCGCCDNWIKILIDSGFNVTKENRSKRGLAEFKIKNQVPKNMLSCHTATVGDYFLEGHVPPRDILRLVKEQPSGLGLAVPGMPYGSPGMGPEEERESYNVFLVRSDGTTEVFEHYPRAGSLV